MFQLREVGPIITSVRRLASGGVRERP
jgi:hypothetical protein